MTNVFNKICCPHKDVFSLGAVKFYENNEISNLDEILQFKCDSCMKIFISEYEKPSQVNKDTETKYTTIPDKTLYFHLNNDIVYNDERFQNQNLYKNKTILIVGAGSVKRTSVLDNLKKLNFKKKVNLITKKTWTREYFDDFILAESDDIEKKEETLVAVKNYMRENDMKFDAIFTYDEFCVLMTSYLTTELNLPGIPFKFASRIRNKYELRKFSKELGISSLEFNKVLSNDRVSHINRINKLFKQINENKDKISIEEQQLMKKQLLNELAQVEIPFIMKNIYGLGKDFVRKCCSLEDYHKYLQESINISNKLDLLLEQYFDGQEIDIDFLIQNNEVIYAVVSDNFAPDETYFFERGGTTPSFMLSKEEINLVKTCASKWVKKLGIMNACIAFEARCRPKLLYNKTYDESNIEEFFLPLEINLRLGGAETWSMHAAAFDVNLFLEQIDIALGIPLNKKLISYKEENPRYYCISSDYHPAKNVSVESIEINFDKLKETENAVEICLFRSSGEKLTFQDYMGWITVKSTIDTSYDDLVKEREKIMSYLKINLKYLDQN